MYKNEGYFSAVVKRLKRDWIMTLYAFVHMIMSQHKMKKGHSLRHYASSSFNLMISAHDSSKLFR